MSDEVALAGSASLSLVQPRIPNPTTRENESAEHLPNHKATYQIDLVTTNDTFDSS